MEVTLGKEGLDRSWQAPFPEETKCCRCKGTARIGFVVQEKEEAPKTGNLHQVFVYHLHRNKGKGSYWLHDCCAVAVYFCKECLETTALYNQG